MPDRGDIARADRLLTAHLEITKPLREAAEELAGALEECKAQFLFYEQNHRAKPDHAKADTNKAYAEKCATALARYRAVKGEG